MHVSPRLQDWPERLGAYIVAGLRKPHAWGTNDCVTFARGGVQAVTGVAIDLPVHWHDRDSAALALEAMGGLAAAVDSVLPRLPSPALAQRGDVVLFEAPHRDPWLAVVFDGVGWAPAPRGLLSSPIEMAVTAWSVGGRG